jgi:epoxyqueuosine reductase
MLCFDYIKTAALRLGFDLCGIARYQNFEVNERAYMRWLEKGYDSSLGYMRNYLDKRFDVRQLVEGAKTVVVCAVSYKSEISGGYDKSDSCKIASYACNRDYHKILKKMLQSLLRELQTQYPQLQGRTFVDSAPLLEKQYAVEAGLGWIGRQSLLITPEFGSYVLLGELVLDMEADAYDAPYEGVGCGECRRCMDACPTSAIVAPMTIDTAKCISCRTIESDNDANIDLHGWIFGCEECQNCCPYNRQAAIHRNEAFNPLFDPREISAEEWQAMSEEEFLARFGTTPLKRSGVERIKKNIK